MKAKGNNEYLRVIYAYEDEIDGESIVVVPCRDYTYYTELPQAVEFKDRIHTLAGWNSDNQEAYYKTGMLYARVVNITQ